jgi:transcriptional regulator with XRE-family HTH domain
MTRSPDPAPAGRDAAEHQAIGRQLARARRAAGLTQAKAATRLGMSQSRLAKLELGIRRLTYLEAIHLAEAYVVELDAFRPMEKTAEA